MILVRIKGGLGNQLFQYFLGYILARKNLTSLYLDLDEISNDKKRDFQLNQLNLSYESYSKEKFKFFYAKTYRLQRFLSKVGISRFFRPTLTIEPKPFKFYKDIFSYEVPLWVDGYWQHISYLEGYEDEIAKILNTSLENFLKPSLIYDNEKTNISIHVRRGDMVAEKHTNDFHNPPSILYYENAIKKLNSDYKDAIFHVFSDDIKWCQKKLIEIDGINFFFHSNYSALEDLSYMSMCDHHIIANSTFSWWAAWISKKIKRKNVDVVCPIHWIKDLKTTETGLFFDGMIFVDES